MHRESKGNVVPHKENYTTPTHSRDVVRHLRQVSAHFCSPIRRHCRSHRCTSRNTSSNNETPPKPIARTALCSARKQREGECVTVKHNQSTKMQQSAIQQQHSRVDSCRRTVNCLHSPLLIQFIWTVIRYTARHAGKIGQFG